MYEIKKFTTSAVAYQELVERKRRFHKSIKEYVNRTRDETHSEVFNRAISWINNNGIKNFRISAIPVRTDPCNGCIRGPYWKNHANPYHIYNYVSTIEVYVVYGTPTDSLSEDADADADAEVSPE